MKKKKFYLALCLFFLGLLGILSVLTMDIPLPEEIQSTLENQFTPSQIKLLLLINPIIILVVAVTVGTLLCQKVNLSVPLIEKFVGLRDGPVMVREILYHGIIWGLITGILLSIASLFRFLSPEEFELLSASLQPTLAARFLYGGITEEILMRFGLMTLLVWLAAMISKSTRPPVYWTGIVLAAIIFALGHFPVVFQIIETPGPHLISYVLIGNSMGGLVFGWLYWKKGLESAFLAHIFAHVAMVVFEKVLL
ncbi:MAG: CPBP family intramembrane metalloprotease [Cyclobacteriaceae bacterium]|nr:CPBP family intramembrane metalloprotease [Cyclobacteriaceae bacterium]